MNPATDVVPPSWPRPVVTWSAWLEAAGPWLATLLMGLILLAAWVHHLQATEVTALRDARLGITLQELKVRLEADLALGFDLADSASSQGLLEDAVARDNSLLAAEVFSPQGVSLFNTDKGSVGERVPQAWLEAPGDLWTVADGADTTLGVALRTSFGEVSGQVCVTTSPALVPPVWPFLWALAACLLGVVAVAIPLSWLNLKKELQATDPRPMDAASRSLATVEDRLQVTLHQLLDEDLHRS